jgi:hypothetical protein
MQKRLSGFIIFMLAVFLLGCMSSLAAEDTYKFRGVVEDLSSNGETVIVVIDEDDELRKNAGDKIVVNLGKCDTDLSIGDKITTEYNGIIMESYPPQVNAIDIDISD